MLKWAPPRHTNQVSQSSHYIWLQHFSWDGPLVVCCGILAHTNKWVLQWKAWRLKENKNWRFCEQWTVTVVGLRHHLTDINHHPFPTAPLQHRLTKENCQINVSKLFSLPLRAIAHPHPHTLTHTPQPWCLVNDEGRKEHSCLTEYEGFHYIVLFLSPPWPIVVGLT